MDRLSKYWKMLSTKFFTKTSHLPFDYLLDIHSLSPVKYTLRHIIIIVSILSAYGSGILNTHAGTDILTIGTPSQTGSDSLSGMLENQEKITANDEKKSYDPLSKEQEKEIVKQDVNEYIIEAYKAQGTKIIKELDIKLQKTLPDIEKRIEAYHKIISALELRKRKIYKTEPSEVKKQILWEFLSHLIDTLNKKVAELEK